jgi:hypothetical protein
VKFKLLDLIMEGDEGEYGVLRYRSGGVERSTIHVDEFHRERVGEWSKGLTGT